MRLFGTGSYNIVIIVLLTFDNILFIIFFKWNRFQNTLHNKFNQ